jgi:hypothetical protein
MSTCSEKKAGVETMWNKTMVTVYLKSISLCSEFDERNREKMNGKKQHFYC